MIQSNDLCQECKHFNKFDHECNEKHYLDPYKFTIECEDYEKED